MMNALSQPNNLAIAIISDQKALGSHGGTFTSAAWRTRDLNTEVTDTAGLVTVASNQFTLQPGRYLIEASAPAYGCNTHKTRLQNITDATTVATGTTEHANPTYGVQNRSFCDAVVTLTASKTFELQHWCSTTSSTFGLGYVVASTNGVETFATIRITRL
ncbi:MAG: hypothetical protein QE263_04650 [Vampirovibrionales bacterium]|nr:hypothetical protein [Vampirovibrionales bacterium]